MKLITLNILALILVLICARMSYKATVEAYQYHKIADEVRDQLEAFRRTQSGKIDSAYICKSRRW